MKKLARTAIIIDDAALDDVIPDSWEDECDETVSASCNTAKQSSLKEDAEKSTIRPTPVAKVAILKNEQPKPFASQQLHNRLEARETISMEERMRRYQEARERIFKEGKSANNVHAENGQNK